MRVTFVGASSLAIATARELIEREHEVVLIEQDPEKIEELSEVLDCGFVRGDGSRPAVLEEVGPEETNILFCVSDRDEANILAALVGRSLGFGRVVPKVEDPDLEPLCTELGLEDTIVPDREVALRLVDLVEGRESPELSSVVRSGLRFLAFKVPKGVHDGDGLKLPKGARLIARSRGDGSVLADGPTKLQEGDEVLLLVEVDEVDAVRAHFPSEASNGGDGGSGDD
jgi:trk system potassium uptake protein TrkA